MDKSISTNIPYETPPVILDAESVSEIPERRGRASVVVRMSGVTGARCREGGRSTLVAQFG